MDKILKSAQIVRRMTGPYNMNTYFIICRKTAKAVIIDPGSPTDELVEVIRQNEIKPERILNTHGHADHFFSMADFKQEYPVPYCLHEADDDFFSDPDVRQQTKNAVGLPPPYPADIRLSDNDQIVFGECRLDVIHTPGHTPGSVCFLFEGNLFAGDTIFVGEAGRTDLPGGNLTKLIHSIKTRIMPLDKKTIILPGHHHTGNPVQSTIEQEIKTNIYITDFILDE